MSIYKHHQDFSGLPLKEPPKAPFVYFDGLTSEELQNPKSFVTAFGVIKPGHGLSESEKHRLVKAAKSPTPSSKPENWGKLPDVCPDPVYITPLQVPVTPQGQPGAYAVLTYREWSDEYRIRTRVETTGGTLPPSHNGPRVTAMLSQRGVRKIAESCAYVAKQHDGYSTFLTLTFNPEQRFRLQAGGQYSELETHAVMHPTTIQKEVSRFCDGISKMWQRGWQAEFTINGRRIACVDKHGGTLGEEPHGEAPLLYCWVAEVPDNDQGQPNPHVHMMIQWRVPHSLFLCWAKRFEELWGNGLAHLEKIKDGEAASAYMMKAAGYLCKAQGKTDQGRIRGNRYGISAEARAPDWVTIDEKQLHIMGRLIADVHDHLTTRYAREYQLKRTLKRELDNAQKGTRLRHIIGKQLEQVRKVISDLPIVASPYQVILKGKDAFYEFINWAKSPGHWRDFVCDWLPEKWPGENWLPGGRPDSHWLASFKKRHYERRALRHMPKMTNNEWTQAANEYAEWEAMSLSL
ncbi:MAG: hypothetical protein KBT79_08875 [Thalassolituus oleivorans]|nr:hypothetical protein [Thalassolituus oleivorans]